MAEKIRHIYTLPIRDPLQIKRLKVKEWKKIFYTNGNLRKGGVAILIPNQIDFETNSI